MPESQADIEVTGEKGKDQLESSLQKLWEKARRVSDVLLRLRDENESLRRRIVELEKREQGLTTDLQRKEQELLQRESNGTGKFTHEEKEALVQRIKDLIVKINSRL